MTQQSFEPGLIKVFRLSINVEIALIALAACGELSDETKTPQFLTFYALALMVVLRVMLTARLIDRRRGLLPITLALASLGPIAGIVGSVAIQLHQGLAGDDIWTATGSLILWLLVPLLLISSQYSLRVILGFIFGTAALEWGIFALLAAGDGPAMDLITEEVLIRVTLFGAVGYVVMRLSEAQRGQRDILAQKNAQLANYAITLEQLAISRERNRVARELHDTLAHTLSAASVQLEALGVLLDTADLDAARANLTLTQDVMRNGLQEARRALRALRVSPLDDLGLSRALRQLAESTAAQANLKLGLHLPNEIDALPAEAEQHIYRIAEEALTNVVRHADAQTLSVDLTQVNGHMALTIRDDGVGFDQHQPPVEGKFGLLGMRERALLCDSTLTIDSRPQQGTTITLQMKREMP